MKSSLSKYPRETATNSDYTYWAFISYSHHDEYWGRWLHKSLEQYRIPKRLVGKTNAQRDKIPKRLFPIFRDKEELASSADLGKYIKEALRNSRFLIVICSPRAAASKWVNAEIKYFKTLGREDQVLAFIVAGEPYASDSEEPQVTARECFPRYLRYHVDSSGELSTDRLEPLAADLRLRKDRPKDAILRIVAAIISVRYDDLRRRQNRRNKIRAAVAAFVLVGLILVSVFIWMQFERIKGVRVAPPKPVPHEILAEQRLMDDLIQELRPQTENAVRIATSEYTQEITFGDVAIFSAGKAELSAQGTEVINILVQFIRQRKFRFLREIQVYAHTDSQPIKTSQTSSNWELSALRAAGVVSFMEERGLDPKIINLTPIAPGQYQPAVPEDSAENRALNRRVRVRFIYAASEIE